MLRKIGVQRGVARLCAAGNFSFGMTLNAGQESAGRMFLSSTSRAPGSTWK